MRLINGLLNLRTIACIARIVVKGMIAPIRRPILEEMRKFTEERPGQEPGFDWGGNARQVRPLGVGTAPPLLRAAVAQPNPNGF